MKALKNELYSKPVHLHSKVFAVIDEKQYENFYFAKLRDLLTIGYYLGVIPFKCSFDKKNKILRLNSNLFNKVR